MSWSSWKASAVTSMTFEAWWTGSLITNEMIASAATTVLSNDDLGQQARSVMAGRQAETETLVEVLDRRATTVVTLSAPLGAGKTFFLNKVFAQQVEAGFPENRN